MRNNNHLSLINFKMKTSLSETFLTEHDARCSDFLNVVNMVSRRSNDPRDTMFTTSKINVNIQHRVH